ncbi:MAG TPA: caspase family protein, partial [Chitinophagaceae bacterium]|nr:caspase family protein [Chitinophagaceae bacterium]
MQIKGRTILYFFFVLTTANHSKAQKPGLILPVGHTEDIYLTEYIAGGKCILTCAYDNTAKLWDTYSGKLMHTFPDLLHTPEHIVNSGNTTLLSSDRRYLVALTVDGYLKKWELPSAKLIYAVKAGNTNLAGMEYNGDGKYLLLKRGWTSSEINSELIDASNGRVVYKFQEKSSNYLGKRSIGLSPDGKYVLLQTDTSFYLYKAAGRSLVYKEENAESFNGAVFSPDGKYLVIYPQHSNRLRLWRVSGGSMKEIQVSGTIEFSPDSRYILSKYENKLMVTDIESGNVLHRFDERINDYMQGHFSNDGKHIFLSRARGFIRGTDPYDSVTHIWETSSGRLLLTLHGPSADINDVVFSPDNKFVVTVSTGTQLWDMVTGKLIRTLDGRNASFSPDGKNLTITGKRSAKVFNLRINDILAELKGHSNPLVQAAFDPSGKQLFTLSNDSTVKIWDITKGKIVKTFTEHAVIRDAGFSKDGKKILLLTETGKAVIKEISSGQNLLILSEGGIHTASFSPDGSSIITTADSTFSVRDVLSGKQLFFRKENYMIDGAALSKDGKYAWYIFGKSAVAVIELSSGRTFKDYLGEEDITRCQFSPDGRRIFVLGAQGTARIFETATGKKEKEFGERSNTEYGVTYLGGYYYQNLWQSDFDHFSPDGKWLLFRTYINRYVVVSHMNDLSVADTILTNNTLAKNGAFLPGTDQFVIATADNKISILSNERTGFHLVKEFPGNGFKISPDGKWLLIVNNVQLRFYDLLAHRFRAEALAINEQDYFIQLADQPYYAASKNALQTLLFRLNDQYLSFEQFDIRLNRPDLLLAAMQGKDSLLIKAYKKAYDKRIKRSGINTITLKDGYKPPRSAFVNSEKIGYEQENGLLTLRIHASDPLYSLAHFNIWVNEVPQYGRQGISIRQKNSKSFDTTLTIPLSSGKNELYTSVTNDAGIESYRMPLLVNYSPVVKPAETVYFIGIGIDKFQDAKQDLQYSSKDIRDLAAAFKVKYRNKIVIDTLFDEQVTIGNIKALKRRLLQTTENDKVIISYSGHGLLNKDFDYYLSTYATNFNNPEQNGMPYDELEDLLDNIPARKKLLLIDACHSGEVDKEELVRIENAGKQGQLIKGIKPVVLKTDGSNLGMQNSFELMQS